MRPFDAKVLRKFIEMAKNRLEGDWLIIGGTVLPLLGAKHRVTLDIDVVGPTNSTQADTLHLMEIASELGLSPESINQAGAFFVRKIKDWKRHIVLLSESKRCRIFRPNSFLFVQLKLSRLSETDLSDCLEMLRIEPSSSEQRKALLSLVRKQQKRSNPAKYERLDALIKPLRR